MRRPVFDTARAVREQLVVDFLIYVQRVRIVKIAV